MPFGQACVRIRRRTGRYVLDMVIRPSVRSIAAYHLIICRSRYRVPLKLYTVVRIRSGGESYRRPCGPRVPVIRIAAVYNFLVRRMICPYLIVVFGPFYKIDIVVAQNSFIDRFNAGIYAVDLLIYFISFSALYFFPCQRDSLIIGRPCCQ